MTQMKKMPQHPSEDDCGFIRELGNPFFKTLFGNYALASHTEKPMTVEDVNYIFNTKQVPFEIARRWTRGHVVWFETRTDVADSVVKHIAEAVNAKLAPDLYVIDNKYIVISDYPDRPGDLRVAAFCR